MKWLKSISLSLVNAFLCVFITGIVFEINKWPYFNFWALIHATMFRLFLFYFISILIIGFLVAKYRDRER